ncbi:MAG: hypothetical protein WAT66_13860, partial [Actinomycetota bacterium]
MRRAAIAILATLALCLGPAPAALAAVPFGVKDFQVAFTDEEGNQLTQAGAHPDEMVTTIRLASEPNGEGGEITTEAVKDIVIDTFAGFVGNPTAVSRCSNLDFVTPVEPDSFLPNCPDGAALGTVEALVSVKGGTQEPHAAVYNLVPPPGVVAKIGFWLLKVPITLELGVRETPPYNVTGGLTNASQLLEVLGSELVLWGNPADESHDPIRGHCLSIANGESIGEKCAGGSPVPFLTLPRACEGPLSAKIAISSWQHPETYLEEETELPEITGCD